MVDTGPDILSSVGLPIIPAGKVVIMRSTRPLMWENQENWGIVSSIIALDIFKSYVHFGRKEYSFTLNIVLGPAPLIISHKDLDSIGLNFQTYRKTMDRR